jgi:predicted metalloprotease with PDZ domain
MNLFVAVASFVGLTAARLPLLPSETRLEPEVTRYTVRLHEPQTQTAELVIEFDDVATPTFDVALPVWRPGRYALIEPSTTVSHVRAEAAGDGRPLPIEKIDKATWRITTGANPAASVRVLYRVYANSLNDRTRHIDDTHAFLSPASVFMYAPERRDRPLIVSIEAPDGWRTATGLRSTSPTTFTAPGYDVLVDSPLEIGRHEVHSFDLDNVPHDIVIWHAGAAAAEPPAYDPKRLKSDFREIVRVQSEIFGDLPYERYVFLIHAGAGLSGGTEHLNSTIMQTSRAALESSQDNGSAYKRFLGLVSHEMFHTWNVKRLRPADLSPYDYAHENYTRLLWVAEGATSYYDDLCLVRAGLMTTDAFVDVVKGMVEGQSNVVGWDNQSLEDSSFDAWVKFNKTWPDSVNTTVSFYSKGALVSLLLDLELRARTDNRVSLDTVMRAMYNRFPLGGRPGGGGGEGGGGGGGGGGGFTTADLLACINELSGADFAPFFRDYVAGTARPDFAAALSVVGLACTSEPRTEEPFLGLNLAEKDGRTVVTSALMNGPAYAAGLIADDEIVALDNRRLRAADLQDRVEAHKPGDTIAFTLLRRDELRTIEVTLAENPTRSFTVRKLEEPTEAQRRCYESWLGQGWDD